MTLSGKIDYKLELDHSTSLDLTTPIERVLPGGSQYQWTVTDGTGNDQMDIIWHDTRTLGASASDSLDLAGGLTDAFGTTLTFARVKLIQIRCITGDSGISVGGAGANPFPLFADVTDEVVVNAGGLFSLIAEDATAYPVTAGTGDILEVTNLDGGAGATYNIIIGGASA